MKYLVVSDIHGRGFFINYLFRIAESENPDKIILLGDIMSMSEDSYRVLDFINEYRDKIVLIKGNCDFDTYFEDKLLPFYREVINDKVFIFTHGHLMNSDTLECDVYVYGHSHINRIEEYEGKILFNPGSISLPRGESVNSYGLITDSELIVKDLEHNTIKKLSYTK